MPSVDSPDLTSVKFRFENIGPVKQADLQLGNLTIIAGRNNTGKTYLVYTLYGFLQFWAEWADFIISDRYRRHTISKVLIAELARQSIANERSSTTIKRDNIDRGKKSISQFIAREFSKASLARVFSTRPESFRNASISLTFKSNIEDSYNTNATLFRSGQFVNELIGLTYDGKSEMFTITYDMAKHSQRKNRAESFHPVDIDDAPPIGQMVDLFYATLLFPELDVSPFVLSAERFGISLFYRELDFTKNQLVDILQNLSDNKDRDGLSPFSLIGRATSRYALPIKDNIDYTRSIPDIRNQKSGLYGSKYFNDIRTIMGGYYRAGEDDISFISNARGSRRFEIPLHLASSSARGLSDLYFFLRHVAHRNHLLIVDEPESHLDTANQRLLARLLARLVRDGLKIIITTHSDYLVKEINNLVMLSNGFDGKDSVVDDLGYSTDDTLAPESVRAYIAEDGGLTECSVDRFGIDMPVFDATIDDINRASNEIASRLYEES